MVDSNSYNDVSKSISRRTVNKGALWSMPVIAGVTAVPANAASEPEYFIMFDQMTDNGGDGLPTTVGPGESIVDPTGEDPEQTIHAGIRFNSTTFSDGVSVLVTDSTGTLVSTGTVRLTITSGNAVFGNGNTKVAGSTAVDVPFTNGMAYFGKWNQEGTSTISTIMIDSPLPDSTDNNLTIHAEFLGHDGVSTNNANVPQNGPDASWILGNLHHWGDNTGEGGFGYGGNTPSQPNYVNDEVIAAETLGAVQAGSQHRIFMDKEGELWSSGQNGWGQLGRGSTLTVANNKPGQVTKPDGVSSWTMFSAGGAHNLAVGDDGEIYAWGYNNNGQIGNNTGGVTSNFESGITYTPTKVSIPSNYAAVYGSTAPTSWNDVGGGVKDVAAGSAHSIACLNDGKLVVWGGNWDQAGDAGTFYGSLGIGTYNATTSPNILKIPRIQNGTSTPDFSTYPMVQVAAGGTMQFGGGSGYANEISVPTSGALDASGNIWMWGAGRQGRIGDGANPTNRYWPTRLTTGIGVDGTSSVTLPAFKSLRLDTGGYAIDENDQLWVWGFNQRQVYTGSNYTTVTWYNSGQLGLGIDSRVQATIRQMPNPDGVTGWKDVGGGPYHTVAISTDGDLYAWGCNLQWALGLSKSTPAFTNTTDSSNSALNAPQKIETPDSGVTWETVCDGGYQFSAAVRSN
ncbi:MAG: hypothetical protein QM613_05795 [Micrococcaceae bacterium]